MTNASLIRAARHVAIAALIAAGTACTMKSQEAPAPTGPSGFAKSITVAAQPDILTRDGHSRSEITVTAQGPNGELLLGESMVVDIWVNNIRTEFGTLSQRNITTGSDGKARFWYTAPSSPAVPVDPMDVNIAVTPVGTDFANNSSRIATIRILPIGSVTPPDGLAPYFTFSPSSPAESQDVLFSACNDPTKACVSSGSSIVDYSWDFGDNGTGNGQFATHSYRQARNYTVRLTVVDELGRAVSSVQQITVVAAANPTASFVFSPTAPKVNQDIAFNASASTAAAGRTIVSYTWDFGDGSGLRAGSVTMNHRYTAAGTYKVTLVVKDDAGKTHSISNDVTVIP